MAELSQKQLEELDQGKPRQADATFYEKAALDVVASKEAGYRIYRKTVYVMLNQPGVRDKISFKATPEIISQYPAEYEHFKMTRQGSRKSVPIQIIPSLQMEHLQELMDMGITTTEQLVGADILPQHLEYARKPAEVFQAALEESINGKEENSEEESFSETENVSPLGGQTHQDHVGRPGITRSDRKPEGKHSEGLHSGRQEHSRQGEIDLQRGNIIDNWKVDMVWSE
jgi:hypothetical protein